MFWCSDLPFLVLTMAFFVRVKNLGDFIFRICDFYILFIHKFIIYSFETYCLQISWRLSTDLKTIWMAIQKDQLFSFLPKSMSKYIPHAMICAHSVHLLIGRASCMIGMVKLFKTISTTRFCPCYRKKLSFGRVVPQHKVVARVKCFSRSCKPVGKTIRLWMSGCRNFLCTWIGTT